MFSIKWFLSIYKSPSLNSPVRGKRQMPGPWLITGCGFFSLHTSGILINWGRMIPSIQYGPFFTLAQKVCLFISKDPLLAHREGLRALRLANSPLPSSLICDFPASRTGRNTFLFFKDYPVSGVFFIAAQIDSERNGSKTRRGRNGKEGGEETTKKEKKKRSREKNRSNRNAHHGSESLVLQQHLVDFTMESFCKENKQQRRNKHIGKSLLHF